MKRQLSPKELAEAIGVSESSLRRWADDGVIRVSRTAGGHRRIEVSEAIRFIREAKLTLVRPDRLDLPDLPHAREDESDGDEIQEEMFQKLMEGNAQAVKALVFSLYIGGESAASICDGPLRAAMARIGEVWKHNEKGIYQEHRATDVCLRVLSQWHAVMPTPDEEAPVAVGGAAPGDPYAIPSLMCATVLADLGFREVNLGPNTPIEALRHAVRDHEATLAWLSLSAPTNGDRISDQITQVSDTMAELSGSLVIGGRFTQRWQAPRRPNLHVVESMTELSAFAMGVLASRSARQRISQG